MKVMRVMIMTTPNNLSHVNSEMLFFLAEFTPTMEVMRVMTITSPRNLLHVVPEMLLFWQNPQL